MHAVDEWWNRAFPAHSPKRLLFILAVYPLIGLCVEAGMGLAFRQLPDDLGMGLLRGGFSWLRYAVLTLSGMALIAFLWFSGTLHAAAGTPPREPRGEPEPQASRSEPKASEDLGRAPTSRAGPTSPRACRSASPAC